MGSVKETPVFMFHSMVCNLSFWAIFPKITIDIRDPRRAIKVNLLGRYESELVIIDINMVC